MTAGPLNGAPSDDEGGRVYLRAPERMPQLDTFPCRVTIRVEVVDDPGPAIIG